MPYRDGATTSNLFPKDMNGELDPSVLKSLGLDKNRVVDCDAFFFYHLILPVCNLKKSSVIYDPRLP